MYCNELHCLPAIPKPAGLFSGSAKATLIRWTSQVPPDRKQDQFRHHQHFCLAIAVISSTSYMNNPCCNSGSVSLFGLVVLCMSSENMGRARSIVSIYSFRLSRICHPTIGWSTRSPGSGCGDYLSDGSGRRRVACARPQAPPHNL